MTEQEMYGMAVHYAISKGFDPDGYTTKHMAKIIMESYIDGLKVNNQVTENISYNSSGGEKVLRFMKAEASGDLSMAEEAAFKIKATDLKIMRNSMYGSLGMGIDPYEKILEAETEVKRNLYWGYLHTSGTVKLKFYFNERDYTLDIVGAGESPFVKRVFPKFEALNREEAYIILMEKIQRNEEKEITK